MIIEHYSKYKFILIPIFLLILLIGSFLLWRNLHRTSPDKLIFCPQDAKLCSDGSYVGRRGPNCEFTPCPTQNNQISSTTTSWYPPELNTEYISAQVWPPQISESQNQNDLICQETDPASSLPDRIYKRVINGREFCVDTMSEGAAGSVYTEYKYTTNIGRKFIDFDFTLRFVNCQNYPYEESVVCQKERESFSLDDFISKLAQNLSDVRNFEDCQVAGFEVSGTNPPECRTPDGRVFLKRTNATWEELRYVIESCQANQVFQAHSLEVTIELKDRSTLTAVEPKIDDVFDVVNRARDKCGNIIVATE